MKTLHILLYVFIAIFIISNIAIGEKMGRPSTVKLLLDTAQKGPSTTVTIQWSVRVAFTEGVLTYEVFDESKSVIENITLWEGASDTSKSGEFVRSVYLPEGNKIRIHVGLHYKTKEGHGYSDGANLYIHHTSKGMLYDSGSFFDIGKRELWKEAWDKGYKGLTIEQIMERDPEMGKRLDAMNTIPGKLGPGSADPTVNQRRLKERELWKEVWDKGYKGLTIEEILKRDPEMGKKIQEFYNLGPGETMPKVNPQKHSSYYVDTTKYSPLLKEPANMKQAKQGTQGSDIKPPPRYDTDSLRNKWLKEGRIRRAR